MSWNHRVLIVGGGPTGLMLAAELALAGVDSVIVERRRDHHVEGSRAGGLLPRSMEVLDQRGVVERFVDAGRAIPAHGFAGIPLHLGDLPSRHNYVLALPQSEFEPILAEWVLGDLAVPILRGVEVAKFVEHETTVAADLSDGRRITAQYLVGCDGGRSLVRRQAGIDFTGTDPTRSWLVAEIDTTDDLAPGPRYDDAGLHGTGRVGEDGPLRVVLTERTLRSGRPTVEQLREDLIAVYDADPGLREVHWLSRFTDATRQAATYRKGRVLVAGDAAHIHPPHGGQGLNTGLQDAVNLGWKLARVLVGAARQELLDSYGSERHPVAARVLANALAQVAVTSGGARHHALRDVLTVLVGMDEPRRHLAAMLTALDIAYDLGQGADAHPLVGRRMPDLDLQTADGPTRVFQLLHNCRPVLLHLHDPKFAHRAGGDRGVRVVAACSDPTVTLPVIGSVALPKSVLIRPDGHVAWAGEPTDPNLDRALARWCGSPAVQ